MDTHAQHSHDKQADLLRRFQAIQARLLEGYEANARAAAIDAQSDDPIVAEVARLRQAWNEQAAAELRERMTREARSQ